MAAVAGAQQLQSMTPPSAPAAFHPDNNVSTHPASGLNATGMHKSDSPPQLTAHTVADAPGLPSNAFHALNKRGGNNDARAAQIGRPRNVGFVPAALRPTERPADRRMPVSGHYKAHSVAALNAGPLTPPRSQHNSFDGKSLADPAGNSGAGAGTGTGSATSSRKGSNSSHGSNNLTRKLPPIDIPTHSPPYDGPQSARPSTRGSVLLSPSNTLSSLSLSSLGAQQAPHPTKAHWTPDAMATKCEVGTCKTYFSTFKRRHHCRRCGGIFCHIHAARRVPLDVDARMVQLPLSSANSPVPSVSYLGALSSGSITPEEGETPEIGWWRSCEGCWNLWVAWVQRDPDHNAEPDHPNKVQVPVPSDGSGQGQDNLAGSMSGSVPRDWHWSTF